MKEQETCTQTISDLEIRLLNLQTQLKVQLKEMEIQMTKQKQAMDEKSALCNKELVLRSKELADCKTAAENRQQIQKQEMDVHMKKLKSEMATTRANIALELEQQKKLLVVCKKERDDGIYFPSLLGTVALYSAAEPAKKEGVR